MPPDNSNQQWAPLQEFHQNWPNSGLSDQQILTNLQDPAKFRSAFPHYTGVSDQEIRTNMQRYLPPSKPGGSPAVGPPTKQPSQTPPLMGPSSPNSTWDKLSGTLYPQALAATQSVINAPEKYLIDPASRAIEGWRQRIQTNTATDSPTMAAAKTFVTGVGADTTKMAVGMVADPKNWPFMLSGVGEVAPALKTASNALFVGLQQKGAIDAVKAGDYANAAIDEGFSLLGLAHLPNEVKSMMLDQVKARAVPPPSVPAAAKLPEQVFVDRASITTPDRPDAASPKPQAAGGQVAPPRQIGEGTSAVHLADEPRKIVPALEVQSQTSEIQRLQNVLDSPRSLPEEKAYAAQALEASKTLRDQVTQTSIQSAESSKPPAPTSILPEELLALQQKVSAPIAPTQTPGIEGLTPAQQDTVSDVLKRIGQKATAGVSPEEAPLRKMVEDAGGKWRGMDSMGLAHYDAPAEMVGGRSGVSIGSPISRMNPDFVQSEFARKAKEYSNTPSSPSLQTPPQSFQPTTRTDQRSPEPPPTVSQLFNRIAQYGVDLKNAANETDRNSARFQKVSLIKQAGDLIRQHLDALPQDSLQALRDYSDKIARDNTNQANFIDKAIEQHNRTAPARAEMAAMRAVGYTEQAKGEASGELEGLSVERQAETAPLSRSIMDQLQGRRPRVTMNDLAIRKTPEGMSDEQWGAFSQKLKGRIQNEHDAILRDSQILLDTHGSIEDSDIPGRLRELDRDVRMLGKFPAAPASPGRRPPVMGPELAPAEGITLARAQQLMGRKVNKIPEMNEFSQKADQLRELANLHKGIISAVDAKIGLKPVPRASERGAVGEMPTVDPKLTEGKTLIDRAKKLGMVAYKISADKPGGYAGWLSPDGNHWIDKGLLDHWEVSKALLPGVEAVGSAMKAMMENGWVRKVTPTAFEVHDVNSRTANALDMDLMRSGHYGQDVLLDISPTGKPLQTLHVARGWGEKYDGIQEAIAANTSRYAQAGHVRGTEIMGGMAIGMTAGAPFGPAGMAVGGVLGAVTPTVLRSPVVANAFRYTRGLRSPLGISMRDWLSAPKDSPAISPEMAAIRDTQLQSLKAPERQLSYRQSLAGDIWKILDPFAFVTDRPNPIQEWTMAQDPRGKGFRDAKGQFKLEDSLYVAVRSAVSGIRGAVGVARQMMAEIETDARNAGLHGETTDYLNLKAYQRAYQVIDEHMQALSQETTGLKQRLAVEDDIVKQASLYKQIESNTEALKDMGERYRSGKIAPGGYDPPKIQRDLAALQQKLSPEQMSKVQDYAKRVFDLNRQSLDLIADTKNNFKNGIISQDLYNQFTARGDEYIPMKRIMETLADPNAKFYGKSSPLYLRQQNVIRQLEGSERVNVDPFQASSDANSEAIREFYRNKNLGTFLDAAAQSPDIAKNFRAVPTDYKPSKGEMVVGMYRDGKQQRYSVPRWLGESLDTTSLGQSQSALGIVNRAITGVFKGAVTVFNPAWVLGRQLPTVVGRALLTAEGPMEPTKIASAFKDAVVSAWTHDDKWMETAKTGLMRNKLLSMMYPEAKLDNAKLGKLGPLSQLPLHPLDTIRGLAELPSDILQLNHWNRLRQAGYSPEAATFKTQTRGPLPDYAQMGKIDSAVGLATTFLRAEWAHIRSDLALASDKEYRGRLALAGMAVAIPTLASVMHNIQQTDDKGRSLWDKVADSDKEKFWIILTGTSDAQGNPNYIRIGKPDFVSTYFNPMEDAMYKMMGEVYHKNADTRPITQLIANTASRFIPGHPNFDAQAFQGARATGEELARKTASSLYQQLTPAIRVPIEEKFNATDQFGNIRPIVTDPKTSPEMQGYGAKNVSPTAMDIGRALGVSPQRIEHVARGVLGTGARNIEGLTDPLLGGDWPKKTGLPLPQAQGSSKPSGLITGTSINQSEINAQNKFYNTVQQVAQPYNDYLMLKKANPIAAQQYQQSHPDAVWKGQLAVQLTKRLGEINQRQKELEGIQLDPISKQSLTKNLHDVKMNLLDAFQGMLEPTKKTPGTPGTGNATSQGTTR